MQRRVPGEPLGHGMSLITRPGDAQSGRSGKLVTTLMVNDVIADPLTVANELRPVLLRLARQLRKETEQLGVTSRQVTLLWLIRGKPGLSLRELAAEEGISAPALSGHVDRLEKAELIERVRDDGRPPPRRAVADRGRRAPAQARARPPHDLARGSPARPRGRRDRRDRGARSNRSEGSCDGSAARAQRAHVRQPEAAPQLPALLHRPGDLGQRHLDAERRARLARGRADPLAARGRHPRLLPLHPLHGLRPRRRRRRRPDRQPQARDRDADRLDDLLGALRGARAQRPRDALGRLPARDPLQHGARLRRARAGTRSPSRWSAATSCRTRSR